MQKEENLCHVAHIRVEPEEGFTNIPLWNHELSFGRVLEGRFALQAADIYKVVSEQRDYVKRVIASISPHLPVIQEPLSVEKQKYSAKITLQFDLKGIVDKLVLTDTELTLNLPLFRALYNEKVYLNYVIYGKRFRYHLSSIQGHLNVAAWPIKSPTEIPVSVESGSLSANAPSISIYEGATAKGFCEMLLQLK